MFHNELEAISIVQEYVILLPTSINTSSNLIAISISWSYSSFLIGLLFLKGKITVLIIYSMYLFLLYNLNAFFREFTDKFYKEVL